MSVVPLDPLPVSGTHGRLWDLPAGLLTRPTAAPRGHHTEKGTP